jgi:two-component system NtrC family sensor kinase
MILDIRHWTLRAKVIFHVLILGAISAGILTVLSMTTQRRVIFALIQREAELVGSLTKSSVFFLKKCGRVEDAQAEIHELALTTRGIKSIRILTPVGKIFASTRAEEKGLEIPAEDRTTIRALVAERTAQHTVISKSQRAIRSFMLVENEPECYSCHGSERKTNGVLEVVFDYRDASDLIWKSQWKGIVPAVLSLGLVTFIILRLFERLINRPISLLKDKMKKVQEGDLMVRLEPLKNDEIGSLAVSFNLMVEKLKAANREIEALYNQRIDRAEHLASFGELAAGLAHEVKNPLSGMKGALEIISQNTAVADPHKEIFQEMLVQIDKIISVIQDFLSYARPKPPHFSRVAPGLFIENAVRLAKTQLDGKDILIHFHPPRPDILVCLDADRLQEVILNLLLNSISAIDKQGNIFIFMRIVPNRALFIFLVDEGCGIKGSQLSQIFNPFFSTKKEGTGLGLSICKKIVDAHKGTISVRSREGRGTTFVLRLPLDLPCD